MIHYNASTMSQPRRYQVVISDYINDGYAQERHFLDDIADIIGLEAQCEADMVGRIEDADVIMSYHVTKMSRSTIQTLRHCKAIVRCGVGYDNVDIVAARECNIPVINVPDYGSEEVADSAIGLMMSLTRGIYRASSLLRAGQTDWNHEQLVPLHRLRGRVLGIIGLGRIGTAVALRAKAIGMDVVFYDPYVPVGRDKALGIRCALSLDELLAQVYVLTIHCPLTQETKGMINAAAMAKMPAGSYLVNTARGDIVENAAIPDAIAACQLAGAGLDVLNIEPPLDDDVLLAAWRDENHPAHHRVIVNPHTAFYCEEGLLEMREKSAASTRSVLLGEPLRNVVN
jgi:D-3-phosphoglycerate dehydrogenase/C-terminal binding protein